MEKQNLICKLNIPKFPEIKEIEPGKIFLKKAKELKHYRHIQVT